MTFQFIISIKVFASCKSNMARKSLYFSIYLVKRSSTSGEKLLMSFGEITWILQHKIVVGHDFHIHFWIKFRKLIWFNSVKPSWCWCKFKEHKIRKKLMLITSFYLHNQYFSNTINITVTSKRNGEERENYNKGSSNNQKPFSQQYRKHCIGNGNSGSQQYPRSIGKRGKAPKINIRAIPKGKTLSTVAWKLTIVLQE